MVKGNGLLFLGILLSIIIRTYFILNGSEVADIHSLHEMGELTLKGGNPYLLLNYNTYPPLTLYLEIITIKLSALLNTPFYILIKLWPTLADFLTAFVIFLFLKRKKLPTISVSVWILIFLLNPISILISSAHGQIDSIPSLLVITAIFLTQFKFSRIYIPLSGLLLGLAISIKPNPLMLVPVFTAYLYKRTNLTEKIVFVFLTFIPSVLLFSPYLSGNFQYILGKLLSYRGSYDFGLPAVLKTIYFQQNATYQLPYIDELLKYSQFIFLIFLTLFLIFFKNSKNIIKLTLGVYLLFVTIYSGISAQYLSWILALAVIERDKMIIPYTLFGLIALVGFYMYFNPTILLAQFLSIPPYQPQYMLVYALGNLLFWLTTLVWLVKFIINPSYRASKFR